MVEQIITVGLGNVRVQSHDQVSQPCGLMAGLLMVLLQ